MSAISLNRRNHFQPVGVLWIVLLVLGLMLVVPVSAQPADKKAGAEGLKTPSAAVATAGQTGSAPALLPPGLPVAQVNPPKDSVDNFVKYMKEQRQEDDKYLRQRFSRTQALIHNKDLWRDKEIRAFLMTPREEFCRKWNLSRAYESNFMDIKYGVTISGPHLVGRMTSALDILPGEKVLEIGTGSGYQSAMLAYLTDKVYTVEIIEPLAKETDQIYADLGKTKYKEYGSIVRKADDGYYGWEQYAPFDKIIVTCGIDHIPPALLNQLKEGGAMVIPVGPPGAQIVLKVTKTKDKDGNFVIAREDIYQGKKKVPFVPFTKKGGGAHTK
ncbi:MAG: protein-L-isoaspartate O-methyltransferase [Thermodesulfobacteriota bacterium]